MAEEEAAAAAEEGAYVFNFKGAIVLLEIPVNSRTTVLVLEAVVIAVSEEGEVMEDRGLSHTADNREAEMRMGSRSREAEADTASQ